MFKPPIGRLFCCVVFVFPFGSIIRDTHSEVIIGKAAEVGRLTVSRILRELADEGKLEWMGNCPNDPQQFYKGERQRDELAYCLLLTAYCAGAPGCFRAFALSFERPPKQ